MRLKWISRPLILALVVVMALSVVLPTPVMAVGPTIGEAVAVPSMISLFGDVNPAGGTPDSPLGPGWTTLVVSITGTAASSVTLDLKSFVLNLLPTDIESRIPAASATAWSSYKTTIGNTAMTFDSSGGIWKYTLSVDSVLQGLGEFLGLGPAMNLALENFRLGAKTIPVSATNAGGSTTGAISLTVVDAQIPLRRGWNAGSVPFALAATQWGTVRAYGPGVSFDVAYRWNAAIQEWALLIDAYELKPLEAFFIHATAETQVGAILSRSFTAPPTRTLSAGWNLAGSATDFVKNFTLYYPKTGTGQKLRGLMRADDSFISALRTPAGLTGYTMVLSIGQEVSYSDSHKYGTYSLGTTYPWLWGQPAWGYTVADPSASIVADPVTPNNYFGWVVPFGAYWVYMENADTLAGFTTTPVSKEWLSKARTEVFGF